MAISQTGDNWFDIVTDPLRMPRVTEAVVIWQPGVTLEANAMHYATRSIGFRGYSYLPRLKSVGSLTNQLTTGVGRVSVRLHNADLAERENFTMPTPDTYTGSRLLLYKIAEDGVDSGYIVPFDGIVTGVRYTDEFVDLDAVTLLNRLPVISNRRVGQKCAWVFKGTECGYSGGLTTCNKLYVDNGGCSGRSNQHRFGGFPRRSTITEVGKAGQFGPPASYQLIQDSSGVKVQRSIIKLGEGLSASDDSVNDATIITGTGGASSATNAYAWFLS